MSKVGICLGKSNTYFENQHKRCPSAPATTSPRVSTSAPPPRERLRNLVSQALVDVLRELHPDRAPRQSVDQFDLGVSAGTQRLIDQLQSLVDEVLRLRAKPTP